MFHAAGSDSESPESVGQGKFPLNSINVMLSSKPSGTQPTITKEARTKVLQEQSNATNGGSHNPLGASNNGTTTSKNNDEVNGKPGPGGLFVKFSMDGAPYLRTYSTFQDLSSALEKDVQLFYHRAIRVPWSSREGKTE
ncbi:hypothetical protein ACFX15_018422 [Malus domestica]